jgi:predicted HTH transcriptional regulator
MKTLSQYEREYLQSERAQEEQDREEERRQQELLEELKELATERLEAINESLTYEELTEALSIENASIDEQLEDLETIEDEELEILVREYKGE